jgi:hypothetical protein
MASLSLTSDVPKTYSMSSSNFFTVSYSTCHIVAKGEFKSFSTCQLWRSNVMSCRTSLPVMEEQGQVMSYITASYGGPMSCHVVHHCQLFRLMSCHVVHHCHLWRTKVNAIQLLPVIRPRIRSCCTAPAKYGGPGQELHNKRYDKRI